MFSLENIKYVTDDAFASKWQDVTHLYILKIDTFMQVTMKKKLLFHLQG